VGKTKQMSQNLINIAQSCTKIGVDLYLQRRKAIQKDLPFQ
jgi:hypothetical protein